MSWKYLKDAVGSRHCTMHARASACRRGLVRRWASCSAGGGAHDIVYPDMRGRHNHAQGLVVKITCHAKQSTLHDQNEVYIQHNM
jgi:hypothetical protein